MESSGAGDFALEVLDGERAASHTRAMTSDATARTAATDPRLATAAGASGRRPAHEC